MQSNEDNVVELPAGMVAFLFTDIEGSTRLWEVQPDATKLVLARHDNILRQTIEANGGHIVKSTGDGCHAVFNSPLNAIAAALVAQQTILADAWAEIRPHTVRVRMAVYSGEAELRAGDYFGPALNRAARLMAAAHGGQVLVSGPTAEIVRDSLPEQVVLRDLGEHRLKDLIRPEHIFQLEHPALPAEFPPLLSLDAHPHNLPVQLTSFVGREQEIGNVKALISKARLITLTGSGGTGKTRLTLQVAAEVLPAFIDGTRLVELAPVSDAQLVTPTIAAAFDLRPLPGLPPLDLVKDYLRSKQLLLILDNCEHLIETCAEVADQLLHTCPALKILASSREGLGITGEVTFHVPSLSVPSQDSVTLDELVISESVQLFVERTSAVNPHFALTDTNARAVAHICQRLDGIPLALELAAARGKLFTPDQIASRLNDRFRLLTGGSRTALPRQQTLRATIEWSYDLLSEPERVLLRRLAVFSGGWTFEAADAVCEGLDILSLLDQLINKSLVLAEELDGQTRYSMLETIRQYARDKLVEMGEMTDLRDRHFDYFLHLSEEAAPHLLDNTALDWIELLNQDFENISAAVEWRHEQHPADALSLIANLTFFWGFRIEFRESAISFLQSLLERTELLPGDSPEALRRAEIRALGFITKAIMVMGLGDMLAARDEFVQALELERRLGDPFWLAFCLSNLVVLTGMTSDLETVGAASQEAYELAKDLPQRWLRILPLANLAFLERRFGNEAKARLLQEEIRTSLSNIHHPFFMPISLALGTMARMERRYDDAQALFSGAINMARRMRSRNLEVSFLSELAHLMRLQGDFRAADQEYRNLIMSWLDLGHRGAVANQLECLAFVARAMGRPERAARLLGAAEALREQIQMPMRDYELLEYEPEVAALRETVDNDTFEMAWAGGRTMSMEDAVQYAVGAES